MKTDLKKKELAVKLRKKGKSIRDIENTLRIARSTLSSWLRNVKLSQKQKERLHKKWINGLVKARLKASESNRNEKLSRMRKIELETKKITSNIKLDKKLGELVFAAFYLAEGTKYNGRVEIANTKPEILSSFWKLFCYLYSPDKSKFRCSLHLRMDQSEEKLKNYWSKILNISKSQFIKTQFDKRTTKPTYKNYKGVCTAYYCDVNLHKRINTIGEEVLRIIDDF